MDVCTVPRLAAGIFAWVAKSQKHEADQVTARIHEQLREASTGLKALVDRAFVRLPMLDDSWLQSVQVEQEDKISRQQILARALDLNPNEIFGSAYGNCCSLNVIISQALASGDAQVQGATASTR